MITITKHVVYTKYAIEKYLALLSLGQFHPINQMSLLTVIPLSGTTYCNIFQISAYKMRFNSIVLALAVVVVNAANVPGHVPPKDFYEDLPQEQQLCFINVYNDSSCEVMEAMELCGKPDEGRLG